MTRTTGKGSRLLVALAAALFICGGTGDGRVLRPGKLASFDVQRAPRVPRLAQPPARRGIRRYSADRVLVRFKPGTSGVYAEALLGSYGFRSVRAIPAIGVFSVRTADGVSVAETLAMLRRSGDIEAARPDYRVRLADVPDDPYFQVFQYALRNGGGTLDLGGGLRFPMTAGADIKAVPAWDFAKGDTETIIAVLDTGVDAGHPDLASKVVPGGWDFANDDADPSDDHWHGTHVAGIAAAATGNGVGVAGAAWNCTVLPVKVVDENGDGYYSWIIDGIIWATDQGADVINLSLGGDVPDPFLEDACAYAHDHGVVVIAAVGNDGGAVLYPAAYDDTVLAVASSDFNDAVSSYSNQGPEVDVTAPGEWILAPGPLWYFGPYDIPYLFASGTSAAAPHAAALAALIRTAKPDLTVDEIMAIIRYTADDINRATFPGRDDRAGYGRINMEKALVPYILD
jgi:subtilisin family serine protease